jgi:hypothetical protein
MLLKEHEELPVDCGLLPPQIPGIRGWSLEVDHGNEFANAIRVDSAGELLFSVVEGIS